MEDLIQQCKEANEQLAEVRKKTYEMVKNLVKSYLEETGYEYIDFAMDEHPMYTDPDTGFGECYYGAKVVDDKLLMTKDENCDNDTEFNDDWKYFDNVDLNQVYDCIIKTVDEYYSIWIEEDQYLAYLDSIESENN